MKEKILRGGVAPAMILSNNRVLHYYFDTIEVTDRKGKIKELFQRVGRFCCE